MHAARRAVSTLRAASPGAVIVVLLLALVVGGGSAWAAGKVGAKDIKRDAVRSKHIKNGAVHGRDIAAGAVTATKVAANALTGAQVADNGLTGTDIDESTLGQVPDAAKLAGRLPSTFLNTTVYKNESALSAGTPKGDGTFVLTEACNPGDILLSGGPANVNADSIMVESFPAPVGTNTWQARIKPVAVDNFSVVVLCVDQ
jgi:hypothetical protein